MNAATIFFRWRDVNRHTSCIVFTLFCLEGIVSCASQVCIAITLYSLPCHWKPINQSAFTIRTTLDWLFDWLIHSFIHSFIRSFIHSLTYMILKIIQLYKIMLTIWRHRIQTSISYNSNTPYNNNIKIIYEDRKSVV